MAYPRSATLPARASGLYQEQIVFSLMVFLCTASMILGFVLDSPSQLWRGTGIILTSPSHLLTDYMAIASVGATLFNAGFTTLASVFYVRFLRKVPMSGAVIAGLLTIFGFSLFGKNLINTIPIWLGVLLAAKLDGKKPSEYTVISLFATALAPAVSLVMFGKGLPWFAAIPAGLGVGLLVGLMVVPLSFHVVRFHHGLALYNIGFTAGIVGMMLVALLNLFGLEVPEIELLYSGPTGVLTAAMLIFSGLMLAAGLLFSDKGWGGLIRLFRRSGRIPSDFVAGAGLGPTLVNMGIMGALSIGFVALMGGTLNGPVLGGVFTVVGFAAFGKHPFNCVPIVVGVVLAALVTGADLSSSGVLLAALFGTTLAPMAGVFGPVYGVIAGFVHMALVANIGFLHGGLNLYNNGFSGGLVALVLIPLFNSFLNMRGKGHRAIDIEWKPIRGVAPPPTAVTPTAPPPISGSP